MPGKKFHTLIVPTDFSVEARRSLDLALDLVEAGGTVILCHVLDDVPQLFGYTGVTALPADLRGKIEEAASDELRKFGPPTLPAGVKLDRRLLHGAPYMAIVEEAKKAGADLIVMSTHGRSGFSHMLIGSVAERVVRKAACPVLVLPSTSSEHP